MRGRVLTANARAFEVYNSDFNGTECALQGQGTRNLKISLFQSPGGLAAGQAFPVGSTEGPAADVRYGQATGGGDSGLQALVRSSSTLSTAASSNCVSSVPR